MTKTIRTSSLNLNHSYHIEQKTAKTIRRKPLNLNNAYRFEQK